MSDKPFPPSAKKLRDARKKGEIPKSSQILSTAVFAAVLLTLMLSLPSTLKRLRDFFDALQAVLIAQWQENLWMQLYERSLGLLLWTVAPVLAASIAAAVIAGWSQTRGLISMDPIMPKFDRLNPASNLKRIVSLKQLLDLAKKIVESTVLAGLIGWVAWTSARSLLLSVYQAPLDTAALGSHVIFSMFCAAAIFWVAVSALDYGIQYFTFMREQRMSFEDLKRENKDMEGDPYIKGQRRALQQEMARKAAPKSLKGARGLVANPTHVSVAFAFRGADGVPHIHSKGLDADALAMRLEAQELGIPIFEDVPLARALYRDLDIDDTITPVFYEPLARLIVCLHELSEPDETESNG